jgi:hypothetical protein
MVLARFLWSIACFTKPTTRRTAEMIVKIVSAVVLIPNFERMKTTIAAIDVYVPVKFVSIFLM